MASPLISTEVYGWRREDGILLIYIELVSGVALDDCWSTLSAADKATVCDEVGQMIGLLRTMQRRDDAFIGHIGAQPLQDLLFWDTKPDPGPFSSVKAFHDHLVTVARRLSYRHELPDNVPVVFTHGDLHMGNILVQATGGRSRVAAIVDWHTAGWYPEYWEFCEVRWTTIPGGEYDNDCFPRIIGLEECRRWYGMYECTWFNVARGLT